MSAGQSAKRFFKISTPLPSWNNNGGLRGLEKTGNDSSNCKCLLNETGMLG